MAATPHAKQTAGAGSCEPTAAAGLHRRALIVAVNLCMFVFGVVLLLMGSLLPALAMGGVRAGSLGSFPLAGILIATVLIGPVLDKAGAKPALVIALATIAVAISLMPSLSSYRALAAAALVYGLGGGVLNTATNALVADVSASGRAAALNLLGFSFSFGAIAAPLLGSLVGRRFPVASMLRVLGAAPVVVLVLVLFLRFPTPSHGGVPLRSLLGVLKNPLVWLFGLLLLFESGNENCMFVWTGKVAQELLSVTAQRAELALVGLSIALGAGRLLALLWLKWLGNQRTLLLSAAVTIAGALVAMSDRTFAGMAAGFVVIGLGMSAIYPTALGFAGDCFQGQTGTIFGAIIAVSLIGGIAGPIAGGWAAAANPARVLIIPIVAAAAVMCLTLVLARTRIARQPDR
ncbi:MAG: MFS transporter [Terriglobia bacterium]